MALRFFNTDIFGTAGAITAVSNDTIIIAQGTSIVSTGDDGIDGLNDISDVAIQVDGSVIGSQRGIFMAIWIGSNSVVVGQTGQIISATVQALYLDGTDASLINGGQISSYDDNNTSTIFSFADRTYLFNSGLITASQGNSNAVKFAGSSSTSTNTLIYTGSIILTSGQDTGTANVAFIGGFSAADIVVNSGLIAGDIRLQGGDDMFDGRGGRVVDGSVDGGGGNDVLYGSDYSDQLTDLSGTNWIVGGRGDDTVTIDSGDYLTDTIYGGDANGVDTSGNDTLIVSGGSGVNIFLEAQYVASVAPGNALVAWITGFENPVGSF